jgi:hypothetical protein
MRQPLAVLLGFGVGVLLAGILVAVQLAALPAGWRTERMVTTSSLLLVMLCVVAALVLSRDGPQ